MAKITYGPIVAEARGKAAGIVYTRSRGGNVAKALSLAPGAAPEGHRASIYRTTNLAIPSNVLTPVPFEFEYYDVGGLWQLSPNPTRLTVKRTGVYSLAATALLNIGPQIEARLLITRNLTEEIIIHSGEGHDTYTLWLAVAGLFRLTTGDIIEKQIIQYWGQDATLNATAGYIPSLSVHQLSNT